MIISGVPAFIYDQIQTKIFDTDYIGKVEGNVADNWYLLTVLLMDIPGKECESIGSRIGLTIRRLGGINLDGSPDYKIDLGF